MHVAAQRERSLLCSCFDWSAEGSADFRRGQCLRPLPATLTKNHEPRGSKPLSISRRSSLIGHRFRLPTCTTAALASGLAANQLSSVPQSVGGLCSLRHLALDGNQLEELPAELGNCTRLKTLLLDDNRLSSLPHSITRVSSATCLGIASTLSLACAPRHSCRSFKNSASQPTGSRICQTCRRSRRCASYACTPTLCAAYQLSTHSRWPSPPSSITTLHLASISSRRSRRRSQWMWLQSSRLHLYHAQTFGPELALLLSQLPRADGMEARARPQKSSFLATYGVGALTGLASLCCFLGWYATTHTARTGSG